MDAANFLYDEQYITIKNLLFTYVTRPANNNNQPSATEATPAAGANKKAITAPRAAVKSAAKEESEEDEGFSMDLSDEDNDDAANALIAKKASEKEAAKRSAKANQDTSKMAKSTLVLDVKPEDSETDLGELDKLIKAIKMDGLVWGPTERVPVAFGIQKLRIGTVVVDDLVSIDELQEQIEGENNFPQRVYILSSLSANLALTHSSVILYLLLISVAEIEGVQSTDIAAFNKI
jgi:translation elongation factor EF-1beta